MSDDRSNPVTTEVETTDINESEEYTNLEVMLETITLSLILPVTMALIQYFCN